MPVLIYKGTSLGVVAKELEGGEGKIKGGDIEIEGDVEIEGGEGIRGW